MTRSSTAPVPRKAMILAAGLGTRMRPMTESLPKPMVRVCDKPLIDWSLDHLESAGVEEAVVNIHYLADILVSHLKGREHPPRVVFSDETDQLMESGGGVKKALPLLGEDPFFVINSDIIWLNGTQPALLRLAEAWDPETMDALLLLQPLAGAHGYTDKGDFEMDPLGKVHRRKTGQVAPFVFAGIQILHPRLFRDTPDTPFSLNDLYDRALSEQRLGTIAHDGDWYHIGTMPSLKLTQDALCRKQMPRGH